MKVQILVLSLFAAFASSCATNRTGDTLTDDERKAACSAQSFLQLNGYLESPAYSDRSRIALELWDKMTFSKDGGLDWNALLVARSKTFVGRLYGVKPVDGGYLVAYKMDKLFRCIFVGATDVHMNEATCHPEGATLVRVNEVSLACPATGEPVK